MGKKKRITLPKNFDELIKAGDITALKAVFDQCELESRGVYDKMTAFSFHNIPSELVRWLAAQGANINAQDHYKRTALHHQVCYWDSDNIELFIELGADIEAVDYQNETPLHAAASSFKQKAVQILIAHGANIHAENSMHYTPLAKTLARCQNADITNAAAVIDILLQNGATITPKMQEFVVKIGEQFEWFREKFNKDYLAETDAALQHLYQLFGVEPIAKRIMHDGISPIVPQAADWQGQYAELWDLLVPSSGSAATMQGEVIRISGRIKDEILRNGCGNWDRYFRKILNALLRYFGEANSLTKEQIDEAVQLAHNIPDNYMDNGFLRLCELAVEWVRNNPNPIALPPTDYKR